MKSAGIIALLLIGMMLTTGCVDRVERQLNVKNDANFPTSGDAAPKGQSLNERISTIIGSITGHQRTGAGADKPTASDRQKAYDELMKQMNEDSGSSDSAPTPEGSPNPVPNASSSSSLPQKNTANATLNSTVFQVPVQNYPARSDQGAVNGQPLNQNILGDYSSFDSGIGGWIPTNGTLTSDNSRPHDGTGDAKFVTSTPGNNSLSYSVPSSVTAPNTQYTLSGWIATTSLGKSFVQVICHAPNGTVIGIFNGTTVTNDNSYQRSVITFKTPALQALISPSVTYQTVHTQVAADQAIVDQAVANEAAAGQALPGYIEVVIHIDGAGTSYIDSVKLESGSQATNYLPQVDFSRIQKYPDVLDLGQFITYGPYGKEQDVTVYKYRMKTSFQIQYKGRYSGPVYQTIEAPDGQEFLFLYIETRYNGTEKFIDSPSPSDFTILVNNLSYSIYTVDPSLMTDNQNWNNAYTIHDEFVIADYDGGVLTPGAQRQGMLIFLVPSNAYGNNTFARLNIQYLTQWWKTPLWRLGPS